MRWLTASKVDVLEGMNAEQSEVIQHGSGPLVVRAGAGSGKTRVLIHRIAWLIKQGVDPGRILAVTFSKPAADEMGIRAKKLGLTAEFRTWHSLCYKIIRDDGTRWARWKVDDDTRPQARLTLRDVIGYKHMNWGADIGRLQSFIGFCKNQLWGWDSAEAEAVAAERFHLPPPKALMAYELYQTAMEEKQLLTYDDFLVNAVSHLEQGADQYWASCYDYLLQDEAQDANPAQIRLAYLLASKHRNYMVVGDPAQAIFGFRGSNPVFLMNFANEWQGAQVVEMHRNYRSGRSILRVANDVIAPSQHRLASALVAEGGWDGLVTWRTPNSLEEEAQEVIGSIQAHVEAGGKYGENVVLYRLNAQSRGIEEALLRAKIPHVVVGGVGFYERKEVKDLLAYLRLVCEVQVTSSVKRALNAPFRRLGVLYQEKVISRLGWGQVKFSAVIEALMGACEDAGIKPVQRRAVEQFCDLLAGRAENALDREPASVLQHFIDQTQYIDWIKRDLGDESLENSPVANVRELVRVASQFKRSDEFLRYIDRTIAEAKENKDASHIDRVLLMSIHKSKGLEFNHVHLIGVCEGILPHPRNPDQDEERRLCYVAMTRARQSLLITSPQRVAMRKGVIDVSPSRFVGDVLHEMQEHEPSEQSLAPADDLVGASQL